LASPQVVIVGGGFGGLNAAKGLLSSGVQITLLDRRNFHLFQPLLYQVATGGLSPADIAAPLRSIFAEAKSVRVLQAEVSDLDLDRREIAIGDERLTYDYLILATGATHHYFGREDWARWAPGLKTIEDATSIRARILEAFELAERDPSNRALLTFAIVGGGPTGVELAGAIGELARETLASDFRAIDPRSARILLLEAADRLLLSYPEPLAERAAKALSHLGVTVWTKVMVTGIDAEGVTIDRGGKTERVEARTVLWAAGVKASPLGEKLARRSHARVDRAGRILVEPDLSIAGHPEVFVLGDLASLHQDGELLPGVAPVAIQQGRYVARAIESRLAGKSSPPFRYHDRGSLAVIGRARAVALVWGRRFWGYPAWLLWLFVHLLYLVEFESRVIVLIQWGWSYLTRNRRARLITRVPESD
jgi:NADH:ubiquinone reductase (H+-translocating)